MKFVKPLILSAAVVTPLLITATPASAEVELSGNVALTSDYRFRGISQSDSGISIQGGFDAAWDNGFYVGTWGAAVDFDCAIDTCGGLNGGIELDYYVGYANEIGESGVSYDIGYIYYDYPQDEGLLGDYQEVYASVGFADFTVGINYSDEYWGETGKFTYYYGSYSFALPADFSLDLLVGYGDYDEIGYTLTDSHTHWVVGISKSYGGFDFSLAYEDSDLDEADVYGYDWADATVIFTVGKSL